MYTIALRNNNTKEFRIMVVNDSDWNESEEYLWITGNFSCDCNRALFFARANDEPDPENTPCGKSKFSAFLELIE